MADIDMDKEFNKIISTFCDALAHLTIEKYFDKSIIERREIAMDIKDEKRKLGVVLCQDIREFEQKTGFEVKGIKIERDSIGIETVIPVVFVPD